MPTSGNAFMITLKFYLDSRAVKAGEAAPVKLSVQSKGKQSYLSTGVKVKAEQWDKAQQRVWRCSDATRLNSRLKNFMTQVESLVWDLHGQGRFAGLTATQIKKILVDELNGKSSAEEEQPSVTLASIMTSAVEAHHGRTRELYSITVSRLQAWLGKKYTTVKPEDVNRAWLEKFDAFLALTSPSRNARNIHFRNIRAAFNRAIDDELITCYPFRRFKLKAEKTAKRALSVAQLRKIINAPLPARRRVYRDIWVLIFCLRGINFIDLCNIKEIDANGYVNYVRAKTHRLYSVKVEPEAAALIERLKGKKQLLMMLDRHADYRSYYQQLERGLRAVMQSLNEIDDGVVIKKLTTYYARHSWATVAAELDIPKETIAAGLGHGGNSVTDIYIDFNMKKVDAANRQILDYVFYGKQP